MRYFEFWHHFKDFPVFSLTDIRKVEPHFFRTRLDEWQKKGYILKLRRGYYMFLNSERSEEMLFLIANRIYQPSYVSLESALSYYGLIPEGVYSVTSVSPRKTQRFVTPIGEYAYHRVSPGLFFGYQLLNTGGQAIALAEREKAVLDYLYFNPSIAHVDQFSEWRFNSADFLSVANLVTFRRYATAYQSESFTGRSETLINHIMTSQ